MKNLIFTLLFMPILASASLDYQTYLKTIEGQYKIIFDKTEIIYDDCLEFHLDNNGQIKTNEEDLVGLAKTIYFDNPMGGPIGIPQTTVMLYYYGDEQADGHHITITAIEGSPNKVLLQNIIFNSNDGPNELTFSKMLSKSKLYKKNKNHQYELVESLNNN
jgi:hypothetical protein